MFKEITIFTLWSGHRRADQIVTIFQAYRIEVVVDARIESAAEDNSQSTRDVLCQVLEEETIASE